MDDATYLWILDPPSRRLRKLYAELQLLDAAVARVRASNPCPEHAPTAFQLIRAALRPLEAERFRLQKRIGAIRDE